jgi:hypothetical protein
VGREKKKFREGGIGQGKKFSDHIFLKFSGGGYAYLSFLRLEILVKP